MQELWFLKGKSVSRVDNEAIHYSKYPSSKVFDDEHKRNINLEMNIESEFPKDFWTSSNLETNNSNKLTGIVVKKRPKLRKYAQQKKENMGLASYHRVSDLFE